MTGNGSVIVFNERQSLFPINELVFKHGEVSSYKNLKKIEFYY